MKRSVLGSAVVEFVLAIPILILILVGIVRILLGAWDDVWRAHRYSPSETPASDSSVALETLAPWSAPPDRVVQPLRLYGKTWMKQGKIIWQETRVIHEDQ